MKPLIIISTYPSDQKAKNILNRCIHAYRSMGYDVLLVSHMVVDEYIINSVDYYIYDSDNTFLSHNWCPTFFNEFGNVSIKIFTAGHALAICRNINASLHFAKSRKYTHFIFTEADVVLNSKDLELLKSYIKTVYSTGRKMLFFRPEEYRDINGSYVYESLLFGGQVNYFLDTFVPPLTTEDWLDLKMGHTLEVSLYEKFSHDEKLFLIINDHSSNIFKNSDVNLLRYGMMNCEMLHNLPKPERPVLYLMNYVYEQTEQNKYVYVYKDGIEIQKLILVNYGYWFDDFAVDGSEILVEVYSDENKEDLVLSKRFVMNKETVETFKTKGQFEIINHESNTDSNRTD